MKKKGFKWLSIILAIALVIGIATPSGAGMSTVNAETDPVTTATVVETGECGDDMTWTFYSDGLLEITGTGTMDGWNPTYNSFQPWPYKEVVSVKIGVGVESIGSNAFCQCEKLTSVEIPVTVTTIGNQAFQNCGVLETVKLPASVTTIGESAFAGCTALKEINIPATVTAIGDNAFKGCDNLPVIPGMVNNGEIKWYFEQATGAFTVKGYGDMPGYNASGNVYAPWNTYRTKIKSVTVEPGITSIGNFNFWWCTELVSVKLPATITSIGNNAFQDCEKLETFNMPKAVTYIGDYAFNDCAKLPDFELPPGLTYIGTHAFTGCENIKEIPGIFGVNKEFRYYLNQETGAFRIEGEGSLPSYNPTYNSYAPWNTYRKIITSVTVPEGITQIGAHNFWWSTELVDVSLPSTVTRIGTGAFQDCDKLTSIELPDAITHIDERAFCNNLTLASLDLPENLTTIGRASMSYNDALKSVTMHDNVTSMGNSVFEGDIALESVRLSEALTSIPNSTFMECTSLKNIDIPAAVTFIGENAFLNDVALKEVEGAEGVTYIGTSAFSGCTALETFKLPETVKTINSGAFQNCSKLNAIAIPDGVTEIYYNTFKGCESLASATLPDTVTAIGGSAFADCKALTAIKLPADLTKIDSYAFANCTALASVQIPEKVTTIGQYAFQNTTFSEVTIPASVTSVGKYTFAGNLNLKKVVILNPACKLDTAFVVAEGTVIHGYDGSTAEKYADLYEYEFVSLGKSDVSYFTPVVGSYTSTYTGEAIEPAITIDGLVEGTDFTVTYSNNVNAGTATATITGIGQFTGTTSVNYDIRTKSIGYFSATLEYTEAEYHPELNGPKVTIEGLTEGTDYTVKYAGDLMIDTVPVGKARAIVTGIGNYSSSTTLYYTVNATDITNLPGELDTTKVTFSNDGIKKPNVIIKYDKDSDLVLNKSYLKISYNPISPSGVGTVQMTVTGQSPLYTGTKTFTYEIVPQSLTTLADGASVYGGNYYTGEALTPAVMVKGDRYGNYLKEGTDYTLEYVNNIEPGTATVKITGMGNYCDTIEKTFEIMCYTFDAYSIGASGPSVYYDGQPRTIDVWGVPSFATVTYALSEDGPYSAEKPTITDPGTMTVYYKVSAAGYKDRIGYATVTIIDKPHTHKYENYISDGNATCETDGTKTSKCNQCDLTNTITDTGSALGHLAFTEWTVEREATCEATGSKYHVCQHGCGKKLDVTTIPAIGHSWGEGVVDETAGTTTYTCVNNCGKTKVVPIGSPSEEEVARVYGGNRFKTSLAIADTFQEELGISQLNTVIVASGVNFPDALAGSYLSAKMNAPILMVNENNVDMIKAYIKENLAPGGNVYLLGGTGAVPASMEDGLGGYHVERLKGKGRYDTNLEILKKAGVTNETILVCTGTNFADSLSGSATGLPILLVNPLSTELTDAQKEYLATTNSDFVIIGGEGAVSKAYEDALKEYDQDGDVERLAGKGRYQTSVRVAERFFDAPYEAVIASAMAFPDGLCGGPLAYAKGVPLILTGPNYDAATEYMREYGITSGIALGGTGALSEAGIRGVFGMDAEDNILDEKYN